MLRPALLATALLLGPVAAASAQRAPNTWDLFGGVAVLRSATSGSPADYDYGWDASLVERPYSSHPWVGGKVESTGIYTRSSGSSQGVSFTLGSSLYTVMGGPVVESQNRGVRPFAHALLGDVIINDSMTVTGLGTMAQTNHYFGHTLGGGLDFPVARHVAVRTQADWLRIWQRNSTNLDTLRLCGGLVYSF